MKNILELTKKELIELMCCYGEASNDPNDWDFSQFSDSILLTHRDNHKLYFRIQSDFKVFSNLSLNSLKANWDASMKLVELDVVPDWMLMFKEQQNLSSVFLVNYLYVLDDEQKKIFLMNALQRCSPETIESINFHLNNNQNELYSS